MKEISASLEQSADHGRQTEPAATSGARDAAESGQSVKQTIDAMKSIAADQVGYFVLGGAGPDPAVEARGAGQLLPPGPGRR